MPATLLRLLDSLKSFTKPSRAQVSNSNGDSTDRGSRPEIFDDFEASLVLSGGNALEAYHLGACEVLLGAGWEPGWLIGASIGAVTAAIFAGNEPAQRLGRLRSYWDLAQQPDLAPLWSIPEPLPPPQAFHTEQAGDHRRGGEGCRN